MNTKFFTEINKHPVTSLGYFECSFDRVVNAYLDWWIPIIEGANQQFAIKHYESRIDKIFQLGSIRHAPIIRNRVIFEINNDWCAYFDDSRVDGGVTTVVPYLNHHLACRALRVASGNGNIIAFYNADRCSRRWVANIDDGNGMELMVGGAPEDFEAEILPEKMKRLTDELVAQLVNAFGTTASFNPKMKARVMLMRVTP